MTENQIKQILLGMAKNDRGYTYTTLDREISAQLEDMEPYVIGFTRQLHGFYCQGISAAGKVILG